MLFKCDHRSNLHSEIVCVCVPFFEPHIHFIVPKENFITLMHRAGNTFFWLTAVINYHDKKKLPNIFVECISTSLHSSLSRSLGRCKYIYTHKKYPKFLCKDLIASRCKKCWIEKNVFSKFIAMLVKTPILCRCIEFIY